MARSALIMHVDMDAFYAAIEQRDHPEYRGRPVVVGALPGSRGVVATCSYEARSYGLRSAMAISEAYSRCPQAIYLPPNMERYVDVSEELMALLAQVSPVIEPVSVDEAYLDISGMARLFGSPREIGLRAKALVRERLDLPMSVGIGPNRLIAKIASDHDKPDGLTVVLPGEVQAFLAPLAVTRLRGVGQRMGQVLERAGIRTVEQLRRHSLPALQRLVGRRAGISLFHQARGQASALVALGRTRKSISRERTFQQDLADQAAIKDKLLRLSASVGRSARRKGLRAYVITLKLRLRGFETHTRQRRLDGPTDRDNMIFRAAWDLYQQSGLAGRPLRLLGVGLSDWAQERGRQLDLLSPSEPSGREESLFQALDAIKDRFGNQAIGFGTSGKRSE